MSTEYVSIKNVIEIAKQKNWTDVNPEYIVNLLKHIRTLYEKDYYTILLNNSKGQLCDTYPPFLIFPVQKKVFFFIFY